MNPVSPMLKLLFSRYKAFLLALFCGLSLSSCSKQPSNDMDLAGAWAFQTDPDNVGIQEQWFSKTLADQVTLPGSMATNGKGEKVDRNTKWLGDLAPNKQEWYNDPNYKPYLDKAQFRFPFWLIPARYYTGAAWYQKEVQLPQQWKGKRITLFLERCHWKTQVWVNDHAVGSNNSLGTPHRYDITEFLRAGNNRLAIRVDNSIKDVNVGVNSHSISDHTQSNWNGIVGDIKLLASDPVAIEHLKVIPNIPEKKATVVLNLFNSTLESQRLAILLKAIPSDSLKQSHEVRKTVSLSKNQKHQITIDLPLGDHPLLWDEFQPDYYTLQAVIESPTFTGKKETVFGMRTLKASQKQLFINERLLFLRGTLESAIFPKTGYPPTDIDSWKRIFKICQSHGLNHIRFHSWCPPEAAFEAADQLGLYLQVECSSWANQGVTIGDGAPLDQWLYQEGERMLLEYGNHPSFTFLSYGNEPSGDQKEVFLGDFITHFKAKDQRRLYTSAAGWPTIPENDFHLTHEGARIQGWEEGLNSIINKEPPRTDFNFDAATQEMEVPLVTHEIGQWCAYPNLKETEKYDGVLKATNYDIFKRSLKAHGLDTLATDFLMASGKLQALCYKADIEAAFRTQGISGFQLLDLHDFPGQGTATVGVLDCFWEEKGYISPEAYRRFCNTTVPLAEFSQRVFKSGDPIEVTTEVAHFGAGILSDVTPTWTITDVHQNSVQQGTLAVTDIPFGHPIPLGNIVTTIATAKPQQFNLELDVAGFKNDWDFWVYPETNTISGDVVVSSAINQGVIDTLKKGGKVLLSAKKGTVTKAFGGAIGIGFSSIFWNTAWTDGQKPHTLGILCDPSHPALAQFPTEYHANWQWWDAMSHSNAIKIENFSTEIAPIVRVIDDWVYNRSLALLFEVKVGKGKLLFSGIDLLTGQEQRLEAKQLYHSILEYMKSEQFAPDQDLPLSEVMAVFAE
ncbi:MAG: sugar-binding domain-containing protein [Bacteroidota bacterium]